MNLEKLLQMQSELDEHILNRFPELRNEDLFPKKMIALQVELMELMQEWRGFKFWSKNQQPKDIFYTTEGANEQNAVYFQCMNDDCSEYLYHDDFKNLFDNPDYEECPKCRVGYVYPFRTKNPLLEEFVDGVHFFLSIANQRGWQDALYVYEEQLDMEEFDGGLTGIFLEMTYFINKSHFENPTQEKDDKFKNTFGFPQKQYWFRTAWILFLNIGINGFGFTLEQIEEAYWSKNKVNYERQKNGY